MELIYLAPGNFILSRKVFKGSSVSIGGLQLFTNKNSDAPVPTFYIAFSQRVNLKAEWTGMNFSVSLGLRPFKKLSLSFGIGAIDLISHTSDKPSAVFFVGYPLSLNRKN
jgi:hypothetical protein